MFQTVLFWGAFLAVFPLAIMQLETLIGVTPIPWRGARVVGIVGFVAPSVLGLWSGLTMAVQGRGTPLPTASAHRLVVRGPYRWVRNPMALAGILQGVAIGLGGASYGVIAYSLSGAILWHILVRPEEEADLRERFGEEYERYRQRVSLWLPWPNFDS